VLIAAGRERVDDSSRRNVLLLVLCQATFMSTTSLTATVASLAGYALATDKALATLPITAGVVGTAVGTIPASLLMRRVGRRLGFLAGTGLAVTVDPGLTRSLRRRPPAARPRSRTRRR
jgi:MFS family permease